MKNIESISLNELLGSIEIIPFNLPNFKGVAVDSRKVEEGFLFIALEGKKTDGHLFIQEAQNRGAAAVIMKRGAKVSEVSIPLIAVDDPLACLQEMARQLCRRHQAQIIGITGSVGKTSTKEFLAAMLSKKFHIRASPGNANTQIGLPLSILNGLESKDDCLILEMAMTESGQIRRLVSIAPPDYALITAIELAHAENFQSLEEIAQAKGEILEHAKTKTAFLPESIRFRNLLESIGTCKKRIVKPGIVLSSLSKHQHANANLAAAAAIELGVSVADVQEAVHAIGTFNQRGEHIECDGITFIDDTYNAVPASVKAALSSLANFPAKRRIAVLGSMLELGRFSEQNHKEVGLAACESADMFFCFGNEWKSAYQDLKIKGYNVQCFDDIYQLRNALDCQLKEGDLVLIKGSRSMQMERLLPEKRAFS